MALQIRTSKPQYWVTYERGEDKARFLVSPLTPDEQNKLLEKRRSHEWDRNQRFEKIDFYTIKLDKVAAVILEWEGLVDENGKALPCDREHKLALYQYEPEMIDWVVEQAEAMAKQRAEQEEAARKNSSGGRKS